MITGTASDLSPVHPGSFAPAPPIGRSFPRCDAGCLPSAESRTICRPVPGPTLVVKSGVQTLRPSWNVEALQMKGRPGERTIGLPEAAEVLGVHYMTAYRYVRTGRLQATSVNGNWQIDRQSLLALAGKSGPIRKSRSTKGRSRAVEAKGLERRLIEGDAEGAFGVCEAALVSWARPADLYTEMLVPALRSIGDRWAVGELTVADEHRASAVAIRVVGRLSPKFVRRGRRRGSVVVGAPSGELHAVPVALVADLLRGAGLEVVDLGANTPAQAFVDAALKSDRLRAIAMGSTIRGNDEAMRDCVTELHDAVPGIPVLVGGAGVPTEKVSRRLGADVWSGPDGRTAVDLIIAASSNASAREGDD